MPTILPLTATHPIRLAGGRLPLIPAHPPPKSSPTHFTNPLQNHHLAPKIESCLQKLRNSSIFMGLAADWWWPMSSLAAEADAAAEQTASTASGRISLESIVFAVEDFINKYPYFVVSVSAVWLIVIPLVEEYLKKCKYISAFDGYLKLRDDPSAQLLDIRKRKTLFLKAPDLQSLNKETVYVEFSGDDDGFVKEVLGRFTDPANTVLCIVDNFDGNSLKAAELLFKSGFKEAYAIKGGLRGRKGWQDIQVKLLPPPLHIYRRKKSKVLSGRLDMNGEKMSVEDSKELESSPSSPPHREVVKSNKGYVNATETAVQGKPSPHRPSSPYPNYPDLKPPSSPTPSKPTT